MTLRVARIYFGLAVLALLGSFGAAMLLAAQFVVGEGIAVVLIALVGLAWWATGRDRAWGLLLWALTVLLVAVSFLVAGVPHSGSKLTARLRRRRHPRRREHRLGWVDRVDGARWSRSGC
jgi:hypothetical protein